jgi:hypothetical protein
MGMGSTSNKDINKYTDPTIDIGFINLSPPDLRKIYGTCKAAYILHDVYGLSHGMAAKLLGVTIGTALRCVHQVRKQIRSKQQAENMSIALPLDAPTFETFKEACKSALSLECQMLEAEAFMFAVARQALPTSTFWDVFIYAKAAHRVVFPDIYSFFVDLTNMDLGKLRRLVRATRVKDRWYAGDGIVAYVYSLLDKSCFYRGYYNTRLTYNMLTVIELLTRKNPTREPLVPLTIVVSDKLAYLMNAKRTEIMQTMKEVYATVTRMYDLD